MYTGGLPCAKAPLFTLKVIQCMRGCEGDDCRDTGRSRDDVERGLSSEIVTCIYFEGLPDSQSTANPHRKISARSTGRPFYWPPGLMCRNNVCRVHGRRPRSCKAASCAAAAVPRAGHQLGRCSSRRRLPRGACWACATASCTGGRPGRPCGS
jgi:hypothetical protein